MHVYMLPLFEKDPFEVTQDGQNWATNKLVAIVQ